METNQGTIPVDQIRDNDGVGKDSGSGHGRKLRDLKSLLGI